MRITTAAIAIAACAGTAHADTQRSVLPAHRGFLQAFFETSLTDVGTPISIAPDLWYGLSDKLTIGAVHSSRASTGFLGGTDEGFCVTKQAGGCEAFYSTAGIDARLQLKDGGVSLAADTGLHARDLLPLQLALKLGAIARWHSGGLAVEASPSLFLGLTNRETSGDTGGGAQFNTDWIYLPVTALYSLGALAIDLQAGVSAPLEPNAAVELTVPVSVGLQLAAGHAAVLEADFSMPRFDRDQFATRTLTVGVGYAL